MSVSSASESGPTSSGRSLSHPMPLPVNNTSIMLSEEESQRRRIVDQNGTAENVLQNVREHPRGLVIALDIDQCSALGEDTFDVLRIVQHLTDFFNEPRYRAKILEVARLLINPEMINAVNSIKKQYPDIPPYIVFYTKKGGILELFNPTTRPTQTSSRNAQLLNDHGFFVSGTMGLDIMKFSEGNLFDGWTYLYKQLQSRLGDALPTEWAPPRSRAYYELARIGIITWTASLMLGLPYSAPLYITKIGKNLSLIGGDLQIDPKKIFLFDDRAQEHAGGLRMSLADARMVEVQPYRYQTMPPNRVHALLQSLKTHFPITADFVQQHGAPKGLIEQASRIEGNWGPDRLALVEGGVEGPLYDWKSHADVAGTDIVQPWSLDLLGHHVPPAPRIMRGGRRDPQMPVTEDHEENGGLSSVLKRERSGSLAEHTEQVYKRPAADPLRSYTDPFPY